MRLRHKFSLFVSGWCAMGALMGAMAHAPMALSFGLFFSWLNWTVALAGEERDNNKKENS